MKTDILLELEPVVEANLNRHLTVADEWFPHEYVPWSQGRDFGVEPWDPGQSRVAAPVRAALELNLLTEDNLPSYHYTIATKFGLDGPWGEWVKRWTAEEGRHGQSIRDYLLVTRAVDPVKLERSRMAAMQAGYDGTRSSALEALVYVSVQELATRVAHRNTGRAVGDPIADRLLSRIALDENLHMVFYRALISAALEIDPRATMLAIRSKLPEFGMPGRVIPGYAIRSAAVAQVGIFNLRIFHDQVIQPLMRHWKVLELDGLDGPASEAQQDIGDYVATLDAAAVKQEDRIARGMAKPQRMVTS